MVERPASVVKELVENSIDAGATRIDVHVEEGGLESIRVTDNGSGIEPDDLQTAFYRHATSKIGSSRDLFHITSLGFRGEALPSIAAVAKVQLTTASGDDGLGRRIRVEGGKLLAEEDSPAPRGTDIQVKELFFNTPARLKYMKTIQTELGHVSDYMYRIALSHPEIAITLRHNENQLLKTLGNGDLLQVIAAIYGTQAAKAMLPVQAENLDFELSGFVSLPEWTRSNRNGVSTIVNGRYIRNYGLNQAIQRAYHTLLPINRYPLAVLEIKMHPSLVDVNVHPAKLEVRFSKEQELYPFIEESIRRVLRQEVLIPQAVKQNIGGKNSGSFIQEQFHFSNRSAPVPLADQKEEAAAALEAGPGPVSAVPENRPAPEPMIATDSQAPVQKLQERPAAGSGGSYGSASQDAWTAGNGMVRETRPASYREWAAPSQQRVSPSSNPGLASLAVGGIGGRARRHSAVSGTDADRAASRHLPDRPKRSRLVPDRPACGP